MARIRSIHPGQWTDEDFVSCSFEARLLCIALRNEADDQGVFEWKPVGLKMRLFPADSLDIPGLLAELVANNQVVAFTEGGKRYGAIRNFRKFQKPKSPNATFPLPPHLRKYVGLDDGISEAKGADGDDVSEKEPADGGAFPQSEEIDRDEADPFPGKAENDFQMEEVIGGDIGEEIYPAISGRGGPPPDPLKAEFDEWYRQAPRKKDPGAALKAYRTARKSASHDELMAGILRYAAECRDREPQFIKHPATWLNAKGWLSEPDPQFIARIGNGSSHAGAGRGTGSAHHALFDAAASLADRIGD